MPIPIDAITSPPIVQLSDDIFFEMYSDRTFDAANGNVVIRGDIQNGNYCVRQPCTVVNNVLGIPLINAEPTEDAIDDQTALYSAYLRPVNQQPIPYFLRFSVPPLSIGQASTSWPRLRLHNGKDRARRDNNVYTKSETEQLIDLAIAAAIGSGVAQKGTVAMVDGLAVVSNVAITSNSSVIPVPLMQVSGVPYVVLNPGVGFSIIGSPGDQGVIAYQLIL